MRAPSAIVRCRFGQRRRSRPDGTGSAGARQASSRAPISTKPTTHPGAYLPHAWIERDRRELSTLDLAGHGRFCLITGIGGEPWAEAAAKVGAELDVDLPVFFVGTRCEYDDVLSVPIGPD